MEAILFEETETEPERAVVFMTNIISFLTQVQSIVRDLKLVGSKMGPMNKRIVNAYTKLQDKHSPYEDVLKGARDFRNWVAHIPDAGQTAKRKPTKRPEEEEEMLPRNVQELQMQNAVLKQTLKDTETELSKKNDYITWMNQKHQQFVQRLPRGDELQVDDLTGKNLPQHICEGYGKLKETEWKAALTELEQIKGPTREEQHQFLCSILMVSEEVSKKKHDELKKDFECALVPLKDPFCETMFQRINKEMSKKKGKKNDAKNDETEKKLKMPVSVRTAIEDYLRATSDTVNTQWLVEDTLKTLAANAAEHAKHKSLKSLLKDRSFGDAVTNYIITSVLLSWRMVVQTPPVIFKLFRTGPGNPFDDRVQDAIEGSPDPRSNPYKYYIFPVLMLQMQPNKLLLKGLVMCDDKPNV